MEGFTNQGYKVDLVLGKKQGQYLAQVPSSVNLVDLKVKKLLLSIHLVGSYLNREKPAVLISANERVNIVALLAKKIYRSKTKIIISVHINNSEAIASEGASFYKRMIISIARWTYKWADRVVAVSKGVADDVAELFSVPREKIDIIYNPIVNPTLNEKMNESVEHPWLNQDSYPVIIGMGRLIRQKDFSTLIRSLVEVKKEIPEAKLMILGEGKERKKLESEIKNLNLEKDVTMPGYVNNPYSYLKQSSIFVLSSAWEGFGNVTVEAMATGTPVVSTDCRSGPGEILENGKYGCLVPVGDYKKMAKAIIDTLHKPVEAQLLVEKANEFNVERAISSYLDIIENKL